MSARQTGAPVDPSATPLEIHPLALCALAGGLSSAAAIHIRMKLGHRISGYDILLCVTGSGLMGVMIASFVFWKLGPSHGWLICALSILAGFGGIDLIDAAAGASKLVFRRVLKWLGVGDDE